MTVHSQIVADRPAPCCGVDTTGLMATLGVRMHYARQEEIYAQQEDADLIYQVVSGAVQTTRLLSDGRRQIGDFYYAGDIVGLEMGDTHRFSAEALSDAVIMVARRSTLEQAVGVSEVERFMAAAAWQELSRTQAHLLLLSRKTACERVASMLLAVASRGDDARVVTLPMGRQDMADYLGLTIETVSRMVSHLQAAHVVEFEGCRRFIVRDPAALRRLGE